MHYLWLDGYGGIVQPGCEIGAGAVVASRAVVPKWTKIPLERSGPGYLLNASGWLTERNRVIE